MQYPLDMRFKLLTLGQQISVHDANNVSILYVKQKMFKLKEHVQVFKDSQQSQLLFEIKADRIIDFSANYSFTDGEGNPWGRVSRRGAKSLWRAHYEVMEEGQLDMTIQEESGWKRLLEGLLAEIPLVGYLAVYLLNPSYLVSRPNGENLLRVTKQPAVFEGKFTVAKLNEIPPDDELRALLALIMIVLLERNRG